MRNKLLQTVLSVAVGALFTPLADAPMAAAEAAPPGAVRGVQTQSAGSSQEGRPAPARDLFVTVGKSLVVDSPVNIQRVSVANGELAEALAVNPREVLVNGKAVGETSLIIWQQGGNRLFFDLSIRSSNARAASVQQQLDRELPGQDVKVVFENDTAFLHGTVKDMTSADRALSIANSLGKTVNLLRVNVPPTEAQILLKVKFADVDRSAAQDLGVNLFSTGATNTIGGITTGAFSPPLVQPTTPGAPTTFSLSDALNIFLFRRDINLGATIKALESKNLLQVLAEPNVLAINGKSASFLAGGEFPYPTLQGGAGLGQVTIQFREFGVRINFTPVITPRGTIRLQVQPEVSSLDFANGLTFEGFHIPALSTRRMQTEIELENGQSFVIGGLLDNRATETLSKIPGLSSIPLLGKLFQARSISRTNTELLVMVTPELVRPLPAGQPTPEVKMPISMLQSNSKTPMHQPGLDVTGPVPSRPSEEAVPVEQLVQSQKALPGPPPNGPQIQFVPMLVQPGQGAPAPSAPSSPSGAAAPAPAK